MVTNSSDTKSQNQTLPKFSRREARLEFSQDPQQGGIPNGTPTRPSGHGARDLSLLKGTVAGIALQGVKDQLDELPDQAVVPQSTVVPDADLAVLKGTAASIRPQAVRDQVGEVPAQVVIPRSTAPPASTKHLNQTELAERWRVSPRSLERWRWKGEGPPFLKVGGRVVYRLEDVERYEAEQLRASTTSPTPVPEVV